MLLYVLGDHRIDLQQKIRGQDLYDLCFLHNYSLSPLSLLLLQENAAKIISFLSIGSFLIKPSKDAFFACKSLYLDIY